MALQAGALARGALRGALRLVWPPQCLTCRAVVAEDHAFCPDCWAGARFTGGLVCDQCGTPLPGGQPGEVALCDDCLAIARPWSRGRAALVYAGTGRSVVLALKHGDRQDIARPAARWMLRAGADLIEPGMLVAPVPLHWRRLLRRRFNQAALLSAGVARLAGLDHCPDLLQRIRRTPTQDGRGRDGRFANVQGAIRVHPRRAARLDGRAVLLVDDVMTSGATLAAGAEACLAAGASHVAVLVLARVAKDR